MATVKSKAKRKERKHVESGAAHIRSVIFQQHDRNDY